MWVDDKTTLPLSTLHVKVWLRGAQMADPNLTSALQMFRRAANVLARLEDAIVFRGQQATDQGPPAGAMPGINQIWGVSGGSECQMAFCRGDPPVLCDGRSGSR